MHGKTNGKGIEQNMQEYSHTSMVMFMMAIGRTIKHQVMEYTSISMALNTKASG